MDGICTLANDRVYDQLVALLNSIEVISGENTPVCVYPYDDNLDRITAEIAQRPNVQLYDDQVSMASWDEFARRVWDTHPSARERWQRAGSTGYHRFGTHRRYCAFDGPFERFLYMDADTLLMNSVEFVFKKLHDYHCVVYDFQHKDPTHVYEVSSPKLLEVFEEERVEKQIFCSGFYASKKGLFPQDKREKLIAQLLAGDAEILYPMAPDQTLVNYMMMKSGASIYNFALELPKEQRTGCCVTSSHFQAKDHILYDQEKPLTYIHYIGLSSQVFSQVCNGKNLDFPYRDIFLHYRYLKEPEKRPQFTSKPQWYEQSPPLSLGERILKKLRIN
ncbi:Npun_R2821/Npun_R2822 family protein [Gloeothece verrucosa]|uniref:Nucleotide-diphospho-sugar transferase superfamily protein n=1 Tax=Gloeothece verrucosa (strain PCC 7822) TaxID=497965 RepID=E0U5V7_GLOV7|nr:Npun_R2821/Npun_R2822 family protein [Gloeothece verrucosa]ADN15948.1 nucleotide-diphospho-sugar transferase superfamily protein [Gloeothece verrucosa PCC 7822]